MFQNKVLGLVVCGLSMALGACAYGADEAAPTGERSSELVAAEARIESAKKLPKVELLAGSLQKADGLPSIDMKGLDRADGLPEIVVDKPLVPDLFVPEALEKREIPVLTREGTLVGQLDVEQPIELRQPSVTKLSGGTLVSAGDPCEACRR